MKRIVFALAMIGALSACDRHHEDPPITTAPKSPVVSVTSTPTIPPTDTPDITRPPRHTPFENPPNSTGIGKG